jgi:hypothetical protein
MRIFRFAAAGLVAAAAIVGGVATAVAGPDCSDWPSGATCSAPDNNEWPLASQPDNRGRYATPGDAKGEF